MLSRQRNDLAIAGARISRHSSFRHPALDRDPDHMPRQIFDQFDHRGLPPSGRPVIVIPAEAGIQRPEPWRLPPVLARGRLWTPAFAEATSKHEDVWLCMSGQALKPGGTARTSP